MTNDFVVVNNLAQELPNAGFTELLAAVLARGTPFRFQASGSSMSPFIRDGDVITLAPAPPRLLFGDVAAFVNPGNNRLSVHRVVNRGHHAYLIRGDNASEPDGIISHADILGRVIHVERGGRRVRFGLGFERVIIAFISRLGWLAPFLVPIRFIFHLLSKRVMP